MSECDRIGVPQAGKVNRRRLVTAAVGTATVGAAWATSLTVLARGRRPQILVVGVGEWQVVLIEHLARRMLILSGTVDAFPTAEVRRLVSGLRHRIDVIAGSEAGLRVIPAWFLHRYAVSDRIILDRDVVVGEPHRTWAVGDGIVVGLGHFAITLSQVRSGEWGPDPRHRSWLGTARVDGLGIALAPSLDDIARHIDAGVDLAIAPSGHPAYLVRMLPQIGILVNAETVEDAALIPGAPTHEGNPGMLARVFRDDVARLVIKNGSIVMPEWSEAVLPRPTVAS